MARERVFIWLAGLAAALVVFAAANVYFFGGQNISDEIKKFAKGPQSFEDYTGTQFPADMRVRDATGGRFALADIFAKTPKAKVIVNLWATWCEPCVKELPSIIAAQDKLRAEGTEVILINYDGSDPVAVSKEVSKWLKTKQLKLETYFDFEGDLAARLKISGLPASIALDTGRTIRWLKLGEIDWLDTKQTEIRAN